MTMDKKKFETTYLGRKVLIKFKDTFVPNFNKWIESNKIYKGTLNKIGNTYIIEELYRDAKSSIYGFDFSISMILAIDLTDKDQVKTNKK